MPSAEGRGRARGVWETYVKVTNNVLNPLLGAPLGLVAKRVSVAVVNDLVGFWFLWHLHGGFEGLERMGMGRTTIFRKVKRFRHLFGEHPDEYEFAGVTIDFKAYWAAGPEAEAKRKRLTKKI